MNKVITLVSFLAAGFILNGCAIHPPHGEVRQPDNAYQKPYLHQPYGSAPLSRHDQRWNPQLAGW